jgi:ornithine cyclodeaminase/alanine dehydrogenase-like protein (mu-crystallin family)
LANSTSASGQRARLLVLAEDDVRRVLDMPSCIAAMEDALAGLARGELSMPLRSVVRGVRTPNLMGLMPAQRPGPDGAFSLKEIVVAPANAARSLDTHQGSVLLHDGETGRLTAVLNASPITEIRTAAVSAVATKQLARAESRAVAIIGAGVQARAHVEAMRVVVPGAAIRLWSRSPERLDALAATTGAAVASSAEAAVRGADVVCTTTSSREPVLERAWLAPGAHVNAVGASMPTTRELDVETVADAALFTDRRESLFAESGEWLVAVEALGLGPEHVRAELGELLVGSHAGRESPDELTVFKSLGLAVEDLAAASLCVSRARERGVGVSVAF